jgi:hypothetical protein
VGQTLLIVLPTKTEQQYLDRAKCCEETWLQDSPCDFKFFSDADLGLTEINQHDNANDPIRTWRTKLMVKFAFENNYDFVFRVDTDAYVWIDRLLESGFERFDYFGYCEDVQQSTSEWCLRTAHGGCGFTLSRRAMEIVMNAPIDTYGDGKYWGDLWAGHHLWKSGINCHRDIRFVNNDRGDDKGNVSVDDIPENNQYISMHPVLPIENMRAIHKRFHANKTEATV